MVRWRSRFREAELVKLVSTRDSSNMESVKWFKSTIWWFTNLIRDKDEIFADENREGYFVSISEKANEVFLQDPF